MQIYSHPKLLITREENSGIQYFKEVWNGIFNTVVFRDIIRGAISAYEKEIPHPASSSASSTLIFSDTQKIDMIRSADIKWLTEEIKPVYLRLGITHHAILPPQVQILDEHVALYMDETINETFSKIILETEEDAVAWFLCKDS